LRKEVKAPTSESSELSAKAPRKPKKEKAEKFYNNEKKSLLGHGIYGRSGVKAPASAYIWFSIQMSQVMKTQFPELKGNEVMKAIGSKWTTLTDAEKQPYVEMAKQDKIRADNEL